MIVCNCASPDCMANGCARVRSGELATILPVDGKVSYSSYQLPVILKYFNYDHLPPNLQEISRPFRELAHQIAYRNPYDPETEVALRKLLESKDAAVRAGLEIK